MEFVINMELSHENYGRGRLKSFNGSSVLVRFDCGDMKFPFPEAFSNELKVVNESDAKTIKELISRWENYCAEKKGKRSSTASYLKTKEVREHHAGQQLGKEKKAEATKGTGTSTFVHGKPWKERTFKERFKLGLSFGDASFIIGIILAVLSYCGLVCLILGMTVFESMTVYIVGIVVFFVLGFLANCLFLALLDKNEYHGAVITFYILTFVQYYGLILFVTIMAFVVTFIIALFRDEFGSGSSSTKSKKTWTVYENGFKRTLEKTGGKSYIGDRWYEDYIDDLGYYWYSDNGKNFFHK